MAGRQILRPLDLRTSAEREGITKTQQTVQAIAGILQTVGQAEKARRDSETLDRVARALSAGATNIEAITAAAGQEPQFGGGIKGILQKVSGAFAPQGGMRESILQNIIGQKLQQALSPPLLTREEGRDKALFGIKDRPGAPTVTAPSKQQTQRDRDLATLANKNKNDLQKEEARKRLDQDPSQPKKPVPPGGTYDEFLDDTDKVDGKFGKKAYEAAIRRVEDEARLQSLDPEQVKKDFDRWWDARVKNERTGLLGGALTRNVTTPRSEFQDDFFGDQDEFGQRPDGTQKGTGFLGVLKLKGGGVATEYSVGVKLEANAGKETDIPSLVPTLTKAEISLMVDDIIPNKKSVPKEILQKAVDHANKRVRAGESPFLTESKAPQPELEPFWDDLSKDEKTEIIQRLKEDPNNIKAILRILERG